nr:hypothetical protein [Anaerolineae bacterium]
MLVAVALLFVAAIAACAAIGAKEFHLRDHAGHGRTSFQLQDTISLEAGIGWHQGKTLIARVLKEGRTVLEREWLVTRNAPTWRTALVVSATELYGKAGAGRYSVTWILDGKQVAAQAFRLIGPERGMVVTRLQDVQVGTLP